MIAKLIETSGPRPIIFWTSSQEIYAKHDVICCLPEFHDELQHHAFFSLSLSNYNVTLHNPKFQLD